MRRRVYAVKVPDTREREKLFIRRKKVQVEGTPLVHLKI